MIYQILKEGNCLGPPGNGVIACQDRLRAIVKGNTPKGGIKKTSKEVFCLIMRLVCPIKN